MVSRSLGYSEFETFKNITIPLARGGIFASTIITFARCMSAFGAVLILAGGSYMNTETLPITLYLNISYGNLGMAITSGIVLDEPLSALDVKMRENLRKLINKAVKEYDTTVLHVTHDFDDIFSLANRVVVIKNGRIIQMGNLEEVFSKPLNDFIADFVGTNILEGVVIGKENGLTLIKVGEHIFYSTDHAEVGEKVRVSIRPENIILSDEMSSSKNTFLCSVEDIRKGSNLVRLTLRCGNLRFYVVTTLQSLVVI